MNLKTIILAIIVLQCASLSGMQKVITKDGACIEFDHQTTRLLALLTVDRSKYSASSKNHFDLRKFEISEKNVLTSHDSCVDLSREGISKITLFLNSFSKSESPQESMPIDELKQSLQTLDLLCTNREVLRCTALACDRRLANKDKDLITQRIIDQSTNTLACFGLTSESLKERYMESRGILNLEYLGLIQIDGLNALNKFINRKKITTLYLNNNRIKKFDHAAMQHLLRTFPNLKNLDLSSNETTHILPDVLSNVPEGLHLLLKDNDISTISPDTGAFVNGIVDIRENPLTHDQKHELADQFSQYFEKEKRRITYRNRCINYITYDSNKVNDALELGYVTIINALASIAKRYLGSEKVIDILSKCVKYSPLFSLPVVINSIAADVIYSQIMQNYTAIDTSTAHWFNRCRTYLDFNSLDLENDGHFIDSLLIPCSSVLLAIAAGDYVRYFLRYHQDIDRPIKLIVKALTLRYPTWRAAFISQRIADRFEGLTNYGATTLRKKLDQSCPHYFLTPQSTKVIADLPICSWCHVAEASMINLSSDELEFVCNECGNSKEEQLQFYELIMSQLQEILDMLQPKNFILDKKNMVTKLNALDQIIEHMMSHNIIQLPHNSLTAPLWNQLINKNNLETVRSTTIALSKQLLLFAKKAKPTKSELTQLSFNYSHT